jgi:phage terminase large subunit-like protein
MGLIGGRELRRVPAIYLRASAAQRLALLQGLMDADGWSTEGSNRVEFTTITKALASAVFELACSLGMQPFMGTGRAILSGMDCGPKYRVAWSTRTPVFRLARKRDRCNLSASQMSRSLRRYVVGVDPVPSVPVRCIEVDSPSHTYLAGRAMIPTHNSLVGIHETAWLAQDNPECDGAIVSPTYPMLRDVVLPLWEQWIPRQLYHHKKSDKLFIWRPTGRSIFLRSADNPGSLSGLNLAFAWFDEVAQMRTANAWRILQARIRDPHAKRRCLFATTTPLGLNWLIREFRKPGLTRHVVRARTADNVHLPEDFEAGLRATYGAEYAAQYLDAKVLELQGVVWPYLPRVHSSLSLEAMMARTVAHYGGVDWGFTNPAALVVGGIDGDGRWYLVDMWYRRGEDREAIAHQAKQMARRWNVRTWWADHDPEGVRHMQRVTPEEQRQGLRPCHVELASKAVDAGVQYARTLFPVRHDGEPRIYVAPEPALDDWRREVDGYYYPEGAEEPQAQSGDHAMDATRYLVYSHAQQRAGRADAMGARLPSLSQANQWGGV